MYPVESCPVIEAVLDILLELGDGLGAEVGGKAKGRLVRVGLGLAFRAWA